MKGGFAGGGAGNVIAPGSGVVMSFNYTKGFGFIVDNDTKEVIMVHATGLIDCIREGDGVTFNKARGKKGMNAIDVKIQ